LKFAASEGWNVNDKQIKAGAAPNGDLCKTSLDIKIDGFVKLRFSNNAFSYY
jgi:hypothetical protein